MTSQSSSNPGTAHVIVRPPLLFIGALLLGFVIDHIVIVPLEIPREDELVHRLVPGTLVIVGFLLALAGIRNFIRAATPVPTNQPTRTLVTTGIHAWTRNPIYLGMLILYVGIGVAVRSPWILALLIPVVITMRYGVIAREERYLTEQFGDAYREYKAKVRRWI